MQLFEDVYQVGGILKVDFCWIYEILLHLTTKFHQSSRNIAIFKIVYFNISAGFMIFCGLRQQDFINPAEIKQYLKYYI